MHCVPTVFGLVIFYFVTKNVLLSSSMSGVLFGMYGCLRKDLQWEGQMLAKFLERPFRTPVIKQLVQLNLQQIIFNCAHVWTYLEIYHELWLAIEFQQLNDFIKLPTITFTWILSLFWMQVLEISFSPIRRVKHLASRKHLLDDTKCSATCISQGRVPLFKCTKNWITYGFRRLWLHLWMPQQSVVLFCKPSCVQRGRWKAVVRVIVFW